MTQGKNTRTFKIGKLPKEDFEWFERMNHGYKCTGETLEDRSVWNGLEEATNYVVFRATGKRGYTRYGTCRDLGDHYIIARYSRYDRIDKGTLKLTIDVEDE